MKPKIAIAGATGFIGRWFMSEYGDRYDFIALSRRKVLSEAQGKEWRQVDLYSLSSTSSALEGADYALYLVHSMQPSTRLNQSSFEDTDLLLADNFARAAELVGLKHIVFIGGILPKDRSEFSTHLRSRYEVELTLAGRSTPVTTLRAGIIVGPGGSSFMIMKKLVERLPAMLCPKWTKSETQPIALPDVLVIVDKCFGNRDVFGEAIEIGSNIKTTYMKMLQETAKILKRKRLIRSVPIFSLGLSKVWVALFSNSSIVFVSPLIESLRHSMIKSQHPFTDTLDLNYMTYEQAVKYTLQNQDNIPSIPKGERVIKTRNTVRSVQRLPNPSRKDAIWVSKEYLKWLPKTFNSFIKVEGISKDCIAFRLIGVTLLKLQFVNDRSDQYRQLFYIVGGALAKRTDYGWLEFRSVLDGKYVVAAIHEFVPRLPWFIYVSTQAVIHLWVMKKFGRYLSQVKSD